MLWNQLLMHSLVTYAHMIHIEVVVEAKKPTVELTITWSIRHLFRAVKVAE